MRKYFFTTLSFLGLIAYSARCQVSNTARTTDALVTIDTLVDVGGYRLHFRIIKGTGTPILFEAGSGADVTTWDTILQPIAEATHAPLITYDRAGFGKSELDTSNNDVNRHGLLQGIEGLERGLEKLGYDGKIMLVASSFGGFCATLYAARHPASIHAAVFIDANLHCWFTDEFVDREMQERKRTADSIKNNNLAYYYQALNLQNNIELMRKMPFPPTIPVIDLVAEFNFPDSVSAARWKMCHQQFVAEQSNRQGIIARGSRHVIYRDDPLLVIGAIVKAYTRTTDRIR